MTEKEERDLACVKVYGLTIHDSWPILEEIINERLNAAKENLFDSRGEVGDYDRGYGTGMQDLLAVIEDMARTGKELLETRTDPAAKE